MDLSADSLVFLNLLITLVFVSWDGSRCWGIQPVPGARCAGGAAHGALGGRTLSKEALSCQSIAKGPPWHNQLEPSLCYCAVTVNKLLHGMRYRRLFQRKISQTGNLVRVHVSEVCREPSEALVGSLKLPAAKMLWSQQLKSLVLGLWLPESYEWSNWEVYLIAGSKIHSCAWKEIFYLFQKSKWGTQKYFRWRLWPQDRQKIPGWASYDCCIQNY